MADPIRPGFNPLPQARLQPAESVRAAQRAFFSQALAQTQAAEAAPVAARERPAVAPVQTAVAGAPAADRPMRPGSLLDIKV